MSRPADRLGVYLIPAALAEHAQLTGEWDRTITDLGFCPRCGEDIESRGTIAGQVWTCPRCGIVRDDRGHCEDLPEAA